MIRKTFFAICLVLITMACSKKDDAPAHSIDDVVGVWEAEANEKTFSGKATLTLSADETFVLILKGMYGTQELNFPVKGTFKYEYPYLNLEDTAQAKAKCQINEAKNQLTIVEFKYPFIIGWTLKKKQ